jgi:hypothetical protein
MIGAVILAGCAPTQVRLDDRLAVPKIRDVLVRDVEYSPKGVPSFLHQLKYRPSNAGERFTIARLLDDRPVASFDIVVRNRKADFSKPFKVVYEWTGKGFRCGAQGTAVTMDMVGHSGQAIHNSDDAFIAFVIVLAPLAVGTVGGFVIGLADGIKTTAEETVKVVLNKYEQVVTYTTYSYDAHDRLFLMRMFKADDSRQEVVRTEYSYEGESPQPTKTVITTFPDGHVKTL